MTYNLTLIVLLGLGLLAALLAKKISKKKSHSIRAGGVVVGAIALIALVANIPVPDVLGNLKPAAAVPQQPYYPQTGNTPTSIVTTNPTVSFTGVDAQAGGTTVTLTSTLQYWNVYNNGAAGAYGVIPSSAAAVQGQTINFWFPNTSSYHAAYIGPDITGDTAVAAFLGQGSSSLSVSAGSFPLVVKMNKNASITEILSYPYANTILTNGGGANNITGASTLKTFTILDTMYGTALQNTQDMTCLIELTSGVNATSNPPGVSMSLNGQPVPLKYNAAPAWYTPQGTNSRVWAFDIAPIVSTQAPQYTITLNALSTASFAITGKMIKTCYTKEYYIDPNSGVVTYDVADSNNGIRSIAQYTTTAGFAS